MALLSLCPCTASPHCCSNTRRKGNAAGAPKQRVLTPCSLSSIRLLLETALFTLEASILYLSLTQNLITAVSDPKRDLCAPANCLVFFLIVFAHEHSLTYVLQQHGCSKAADASSPCTVKEHSTAGVFCDHSCSLHAL